ncbi:unnamed protein product [Durusdinium trenchii]|uniref:Uncharacterized protein n=1 Tax=Durusdinium trenchii TaxID=1381693 RepID=A0ABP0PS19_9DINO
MPYQVESHQRHKPLHPPSLCSRKAAYLGSLRRIKALRFLFEPFWACDTGRTLGRLAEAQNPLARLRRQTRDEALELSLERRQDKGIWRLAAGEGLDWQHIRNEFYTAQVQSFAEVSLDDCIDAHAASRQEGLRLLDLGCGVGALLARLRRERGEVIDWPCTAGVTSVHPFDVSMFTPPAGYPEFFEAQLLRFNLDFLADHADTPADLAGRRFDLITSHYCWCHLQDPLGALVCAFGLLRAGGILLFFEPLHAPSNSLPYTDHRLYHWNDQGESKPLFMRQLLQHWQQEVAVFSALERGEGDRKHVLALRKHGENQQLSLPASVCPGATAAPLPAVREARLRCGDQEPFVTPSARSFPEWLQKAKTQRLQRVAL